MRMGITFRGGQDNPDQETAVCLRLRYQEQALEGGVWKDEG